MSWKNVREHYRLDHIVHIDEDGLAIGSGYMPAIIRIDANGAPCWSSAIGPSANDKLARCMGEMRADPGTLRRLIAEPDTFERSIPVWTYDCDGNIIEHACETPGWPNCTHDGRLMYENTFSTDRAEVVRWARSELLASAKNSRRRVAECWDALDKAYGRLADDQVALVKLRRDGFARQDAERN